MNCQKAIKKFQTIRSIGKGGYAEIFLVIDQESKEQYALKIIDETKYTGKQAVLLKNEIRILSQVNHPNIIKLYKVLQDSKMNGYKYLILEYCNGGSLKNNLNQYMSKWHKPFPEKFVQKIMKNILSGVKYLHDQGIIHRDLKLENILVKYINDFDLQNQNLYNAEIKIIYFNISYLPNLCAPTTIVGTVPNMAPSVVENLMMMPA
jgi:serine/threonine protein kinase